MRKAIWITIAIVWCAMIYSFTQSPLFTFASTDSKIAAFFGISDWRVANAINHVSRKGAHFILFAVLAVFLKVMMCDFRGSYWIAWIGASVYGITDELHQMFVAGRGPSVVDVAIDSAGAGAGLVIYYLIARKHRHARSKGGKEA